MGGCWDGNESNNPYSLFLGFSCGGRSKLMRVQVEKGEGQGLKDC